MNPFVQKLLDAAKQSGLEGGEVAVLAFVKKSFVIAQEAAAASENKFDDVAVSILVSFQGAIEKEIDKIDGKPKA